jgi:hypothetical protein
MPMALCLQGYFMHLMGLPALVGKANVYEAASKIKAQTKKKSHISALGRGATGSSNAPARSSTAS